MTQDRLNARLRATKLWGLAFIVLTVIAWIAIRGLHQLIGGLFIGELGGAYVLVSLIGQGHRNDDMEGTALFASGMLGMFTRIIALVIVMVVAEHWRTYFNPYTALVGYLLGFVFVVAGLYGFAKSRKTDS
ncbi:hypothetical protein [Alicyclobacillus ferrooxydans]|uniref:ATP synthase subunit I n=1 Tax=Alicyclobacillus ferrooxydans TaxID=471514 RepID=A0A0P9CIF6_9BACL|nr:hypothetical protein [Alicyclobacillus ferrooxydans]KPV42816.1 hypothetical protein AN477_15915 [Alicyclobacillus ferrooxydans]